MQTAESARGLNRPASAFSKEVGKMTFYGVKIAHWGSGINTEIISTVAEYMPRDIVRREWFGAYAVLWFKRSAEAEEWLGAFMRGWCTNV